MQGYLFLVMLFPLVSPYNLTTANYQTHHSNVRANQAVRWQPIPLREVKYKLRSIARERVLIFFQIG